MFKKIKTIDDRVVDKMYDYHKKPLIWIMRFFSALGNQGKIWFAMCLPMIISYKFRIFGLNILTALILTCIAGEGLIKHIVCRIRPCHKIADYKLAVKKRPAFYSFPSGHTASSFCVFTVTLHYTIPLAILVLFVALFISFSRIYLQVHYLTDVLAGIALGIICGIISVKLFTYFPSFPFLWSL